MVSLSLLACAPAVETGSPQPLGEPPYGPPDAPPDDLPDAPPDDPPYEAPLAEAGFLNVPGQAGAADYEARLFYSFHPAEREPEKAPLLVFFNGGPGGATSGGLLAFGTGPVTMTSEMVFGDMPIENPDRMSRFAHLLYVDARQTGFSYGLTTGGCAGSPDAVLDAADFVFALLDFLDARPALRAAPVVLVGQSYGGTRAAIMLQLLQRYASAAPPSSLLDPSRIPGLRERVQAHLDATHPGRAGERFSPEEVASQFGWQVLVQPNFAGTIQFDFEMMQILQDPRMQEAMSVPGVSFYDVRILQEELDRIGEVAARAVVNPAGFEAFTGVAPATVAGLGAADRQAAFREKATYSPPPEATAALEAELGELPTGDYYWGNFATPCNGSWFGDGEALLAFLSQLPHTRAFVTRARYDAVVYSPALPGLLDLAKEEVTLDDAPRPGVERPGWIQVAFETGEKAEIRFPPYEAGHAVSLTAARELSADVEVWLREVGAFAE